MLGVADISCTAAAAAEAARVYCSADGRFCGRRASLGRALKGRGVWLGLAP